MKAIQRSNSQPKSFKQTLEKENLLDNRRYGIINSKLKKQSENYLPQIMAVKEVNKKQRLDKRMLRSKIQTILEQNFFYKCPRDKLIVHENKLRKWQQRHKQIKNEEFLEAFENQTAERKQIDFQYSKTVSQEYVPNLKDLTTPYTVPKHLEKERFVEKNILEEICQYLTNNEILEIGEDPNYFISAARFREQFPELLDPKSWDEYVNQRQQQSRNKQPIENSRSISYSQQLHAQQLKQYQYNEEQYQQVLERRFKKIQNQQKFYKTQSRERLQRYEKSSKFKEEEKLNTIWDYKLELAKKQMKAEACLNQVQDNISNYKKELLTKFFEKQAKKKEKLKEYKEQSEIYNLSTQLKSICLEKQVKRNKKQIQEQKANKIIELRELQSRLKLEKFKSEEKDKDAILF